MLNCYILHILSLFRPPVYIAPCKVYVVFCNLIKLTVIYKYIIAIFVFMFCILFADSPLIRPVVPRRLLSRRALSTKEMDVIRILERGQKIELDGKQKTVHVNDTYLLVLTLQDEHGEYNFNYEDCHMRLRSNSSPAAANGKRSCEAAVSAQVTKRTKGKEISEVAVPAHPPRPIAEHKRWSRRRWLFSWRPPRAQEE